MRFAAILLGMTVAMAASGQAATSATITRQAIQAELEDFSAPGWNHKPAAWSGGLFSPPLGPALTRYREQLVRVAGWAGGPLWHQAGYLPWKTREGKTEKLAVNVFFPEGPSKGTLLFVHGYMSHAANFAYTFAFFTARGWTVTTLDLPGHGLSTGPRADIAEFGEYGDAARLWMDWVWKQDWPGPRILMAHSLGTAACFDALDRPGTPRPDKIIFCAPLLRTTWYTALTLAEALAGWAVKDVPSRLAWDHFIDGRTMPTHWFQALMRWLDGLNKRQPKSMPLTIYQGDKDTVVDAGWNIEEYRRLVPGVKIIMLRGAGHLFLSGRVEHVAFHERLAADLGL